LRLAIYCSADKQWFVTDFSIVASSNLSWFCSVLVCTTSILHGPSVTQDYRCYRAMHMHYSAKRGIAIARRPSVCLWHWWIRTT